VKRWIGAKGLSQSDGGEGMEARGWRQGDRGEYFEDLRRDAAGSIRMTINHELPHTDG